MGATKHSEEAHEQHEALQLASRASSRQQNAWPATEEEDTLDQEPESGAAAAVVAQADGLDRQLRKEPLLVRSELREANLVSTDEGNSEAAEQQVDHKLEQEELVAATLVTDINDQQLFKASSKLDTAELGESHGDTSPRTDLLALARAKRARTQEQQQDSAVTHQIQTHHEMQLSALKANSKIVVNGEATKQTNRIAEVEASIDQNEALVKQDQRFVDRELVPKVEALRQTAKAALRGEEHAIDLSSQEVDAVKRLHLQRASIEANTIKNQEYEFLHE